MARPQVFKDRSGKWHYTLDGVESEGFRREDLARKGLADAIVEEQRLADELVEKERVKAQQRAARAEAKSVTKAEKVLPVAERDAPKADPEDVAGAPETE